MPFKVVGVGGSGCAAVERMGGCEGCRLVAINTDAASLLERKVENKVLIGLKVTKGRSTGNNLKLGQEAAVADLDKIKSALAGSKLTFLIAGLGGGTGAGAAPVVAEAAKSLGSTVVAFVNLPFTAEGKICQSNSEKGLQGLRPYCDLIIVVENDRFLQMVPNMSLRDAFTKVNHILLEAVQGMAKLTADSGVDNVKPMLNGYGTIGHGVGPSLRKAVDACLGSALIGADIREAKNVLINFTANTPLQEGLQEALDQIAAKTNPQAGILWTSTRDAGAEGVEALAVFSGVRYAF
ncbi:MAG: cell division protein FtsZ [Candidatus Altiarchaeota archaeon]